MTLDFLLIGAQKCATTWMYHCLNEHPGLFVGGGKNESLYFGGETFNNQGKDWFEGLFADAGENQKLGRASVDYVWDPQSIDQAQKAYPEIKIIAALRNPVERTISAFYWLMRKNIIAADTLDEGITRAIADFREGKETAYSSLIRRSLFTQTLIDLHGKFDKERIKLVLFDDIQMRPKKVLHANYSFLGVDPHYTPASLKRKPKGNSYSSTLVYLERKMPVNKFTTKLLNGISEVIKISSQTKRPDLDPRLAQELKDIYREPYDRLFDWMEANGSEANRAIIKAKKSWKL